MLFRSLSAFISPLFFLSFSSFAVVVVVVVVAPAMLEIVDWLRQRKHVEGQHRSLVGMQVVLAFGTPADGP